MRSEMLVAERAEGSATIPSSNRSRTPPIVVPPELRGPAISLQFNVIDACDHRHLHPAESRCLSSRAVTVRQREFAAGRACAAQAMEALGLERRPVLMAVDRSPIWPDGLLGSISHTRELAGTALALRSSGSRAIGLDLEEALPLDDSLVAEVAFGGERSWLSRQRADNRGILAKAIFCAKEAAYKCQYPLTQEMFGFEFFHIDLQLDRKRFTATFLKTVHPFQAGDQLDGCIWLSGDHIVALAALR